jgi:hypothetical protein
MNFMYWLIHAAIANNIKMHIIAIPTALNTCNRVSGLRFFFLLLMDNLFLIYMINHGYKPGSIPQRKMNNIKL